MLLSLVFLPIFEVEANRETGTYYGDRIFGAFATQLRTSTWVPALIALGFATGFIHYLLDRSVYRMSDPRVRAAASGLIGNVARRSRRKNCFVVGGHFSVRDSLCLVRCTRRSQRRRRDNSLQRRSTRPSLFTDLNGRNKGSQVKASFWSPLTNGPAKLPERECCKAPETNN